MKIVPWKYFPPSALPPKTGEMIYTQVDREDEDKFAELE